MATLAHFPGTQGLLERPITVDNTDGNVQIVREFEGRSLSVGLFDFDGTISDERVGWPNLAVANNVAFLVALTTPHTLGHRKTFFDGGRRGGAGKLIHVLIVFFFFLEGGIHIVTSIIDLGIFQMLCLSYSLPLSPPTTFVTDTLIPPHPRPTPTQDSEND